MLKAFHLESDQNIFTLAFRDQSLEVAFHANHAKKVLPQVRIALIIAALLYATFTILDFITIVENRIPALTLRFGFAIPLFVLGYLATFRVYFRKRLQMLVSVLLCIASIGIVLIAIKYENIKSDIFFTGTLLPLFWAFLYSGLRFINAVKVSLCIIFIYELFFFLFSDIPYETLVALNFFIFTSLIIGVLGGYTIEQYFRRDFVNQRLIRLEKQKNEKLLLNILPKSIANELKAHEGTIARDYEQVTILFADLVGFTQLSQNQSAKEVVTILNEIFSQFDKLTDKYALEKIKTIGDAYMVTSIMGIDKIDAVESVANFALAVHEEIASYNQQSGRNISIRIGMHSGPAVAGVIGVKKFIYDIWGSTVNIASRMQSHSLVDRTQVSQATYELIKDRFVFEERGEIVIKGMNNMRTYLLIEKR